MKPLGNKTKILKFLCRWTVEIDQPSFVDHMITEIRTVVYSRTFLYYI
jgi:hypothetical protein